MSFTLVLLFVPYLIFLGMCAVLAFFGFYNMQKYGFLDWKSLLGCCVFVGVVGLILFATAYYASFVDWTEEIVLYSY